MTATLHTKYSLPGNPPTVVWQTSDLDGILADYTLTENGRLMRTDYRVDVTDQTKPPAPTPSSTIEELTYSGFYTYQERYKKSRLSGRWPLELVSTAIVDTHCHGRWTFWATVYNLRGKDSWWQYDVTFENGLLVSVEGGRKYN